MAWAGLPDCVLADQGPEFKKDFQKEAERFGMRLRMTATEAPWQHGITERHGKVLAEIVEATVEQLSLTRVEDMKHALTAANVVKNHRIGRDGFSPRQRVFGSGERLPCSLVDNMLDTPNIAELGLLDSDPIFERSSKIDLWR